MISKPQQAPCAGHRDAVPLATMPAGTEARFCKANLHCEDCALLQAMGLTERCTLRVWRGGAPCIIEVDSTRLALAAPLAREIFVTELDDDGETAR